jgi:hypothetical protein
MIRLGCLGLIVTLSTAIFTSSIFAQTANEEPKGANALPPTNELLGVSTEGSAPKAEEDEQQMQYAPALNGTGLIPLDSSVPSHLLLGATIASGWDSNPQNLGNGVASGLYTLSPYLGVQAITPKTQFLLQYQFTHTGFSSSYAGQNMNVASASILSNVNSRWSWDLKTVGSYGQDSVRFLGSQQTVAVGEVPGTGPNSASYLANAGTVTYVEGDVGVKYRKSQRDTIELRVANNFSSYTGLKEKNGTATINLLYDRDLSPTLGMGTYLQGVHYYGTLRCESYGGGLGLHWQPSEKTLLSLSGGPQISTSECGSQQGFAYSVSFSTRLSSKSQIYLLSARQPTTSYLGPGLWQESSSGGYQRQVMTWGTVSFDVGYAASDTLAEISSYHGTYFDCSYSYRLTHGLRASSSYRGYVGDSGGTHYSRNVALFSIVWTPGAGHIFQ